MPRKILVADLLCGAGGSSTGCSRALAGERNFQSFVARVYLREASRRRSQRGFHATLLQWSANARLRRQKLKPAQLDLFWIAAA